MQILAFYYENVFEKKINISKTLNIFNFSN